MCESHVRATALCSDSHLYGINNHIKSICVYHELPMYANEIEFNPIALRKAKIVYNFGLSWCHRIELIPLRYA